MVKKKNLQECVVCMTPGHTRQPFNCRTCSEIMCEKCVGRLVDVCECGCPSARYNCPTCRAETAFIIDHVDSPVVLKRVIVRMRAHLSGEGSDAEEGESSDSDSDYVPSESSRRRRRRRN